MPLDLDSLLRIPFVDTDRGYDISPDGKHLVFAWNLPGKWEIYNLNLDTLTPPQKITTGLGAKFAPCFSPDGRYLAYSVDMDGAENFDIHLTDLASHRSINLTPDTTESIIPGLSWSPDGDQIAFISNRSGQFNAYRMPVMGGLALQVCSSPYPAVNVTWSPDGSCLAVTAATQAQDYHTTIVSTTGDADIPIKLDDRAINCCDVRWSPDGSRLVFASDAGGQFDIGVFEIDSGQITWITSGEGDKRQPDWSPDGQQIVYVHHYAADAWLEIYSMDDGSKIISYKEQGGVFHEPHFTPDGKRIISIFESPERPPDMWLMTLENGTSHQITNSLPGDLLSSALFEVNHIWYPGLDEVPVPAMLYQPVDKSPFHPAVVVIHGGPNWSIQSIWYPLMAHMASRGWVVLAPNYRGSTGYGREWQNANRFDLGGVDLEDVLAGAQFLEREKLADPRRIAVTGRSHGGYLTMACLTQYPQQWIGGSAVVPFLNWFSSHANSRLDLQVWDIENMGDSQQNYQLWHDRSPFFFLERIKAPVQLICGANDPRCPASESLAARDALIALGKQVELVLYPDEGHEFLKIENIVDHELRRVAFLAGLLENG